MSVALFFGALQVTLLKDLCLRKARAERRRKKEMPCRQDSGSFCLLRDALTGMRES